MAQLGACARQRRRRTDSPAALLSCETAIEIWKRLSRRGITQSASRRSLLSTVKNAKGARFRAPPQPPPKPQLAGAQDLIQPRPRSVASASRSTALTDLSSATTLQTFREGSIPVTPARHSFWHGRRRREENQSGWSGRRGNLRPLSSITCGRSGESRVLQELMVERQNALQQLRENRDLALATAKLVRLPLRSLVRLRRRKVSRRSLFLRSTARAELL